MNDTAFLAAKAFLMGLQYSGSIEHYRGACAACGNWVCIEDVVGHVEHHVGKLTPKLAGVILSLRALGVEPHDIYNEIRPAGSPQSWLTLVPKNGEQIYLPTRVDPLFDYLRRSAT